MQLLDRRFKNHLKALKINNESAIAVACSGGPDSMALALLVKEWADKQKGKVIALTVDHGWRKGSAQEAKQVGQWLKKHGILHAILPWKGRKPSRNQHDAVRKARYQLLTEYCKQHNIPQLFVAHHLEDQAETFLLRLTHGGSVDGLSAMPAITTMYDVMLVRPILSFAKRELLEYLSRQKQPFVNDPGNFDTKLDKIKIRKLLPVLAEAGISAERLAKTATIMARARAHLEEQTGSFLKTYCKIFPEGYAMLKAMPTSDEIALRVISTLMMIVGGQEVKTRAAELERLRAAITSPGFKGMTLGGCVFQQQKENILVYRDLRAIAPDRWVKPGTECVWDNRFEIALKASPQRLKVGTLTKAGWNRIAKFRKDKITIPNNTILYGLPAFRDAKGVIMAVPHLNYCPDKTVLCMATFSHSM
jgi:tRNA(Ile)-lysidine synthase